jgi:hypothetical protein
MSRPRQRRYYSVPGPRSCHPGARGAVEHPMASVSNDGPTHGWMSSQLIRLISSLLATLLSVRISTPETTVRNTNTRAAQDQFLVALWASKRRVRGPGRLDEPKFSQITLHRSRVGGKIQNAGSLFSSAHSFLNIRRILLARMVVIQLLSVAIIIAVTVLVRRRYAVGLSDIPGPFMASFSTGWQVWRVIRGDIEWQSIRLHEKHGRLSMRCLWYLVLNENRQLKKCASHHRSLRSHQS